MEPNTTYGRKFKVKKKEEKTSHTFKCAYVWVGGGVGGGGGAIELWGLTNGIRGRYLEAGTKHCGK